jgi:uncharacterized protein
MNNVLQNELLHTPFLELPLGAIKPEGWLKDQLLIQANGLTGKLSDYWDDVGANSGWLGGTGESWERGPYYLDGLLPLAYLLNDEKLINKVQRWMDWTLGSQTEEGQFGPANNDDWWCRMVMLKVLIQYEEVTGDQRVIPFMLKYFEYQRKHINERPLSQWGEARGAENMLCLHWLYNRTGEKWLLELAEIIRKQTIDWTEIYSDFPFWRYQTRFDHRVHVVNVAMSLKYPALSYLQTGNERDKAASLKGIKSLMNYHGQVHGMFSGDEWLAGTHPSQGVELCAVVEYMFSLENLTRIFGDGQYADILEKVTFNALPATITADWHGHQYDQQVNQVLCTQARRNWTLNGDESNMFGLEPNFGCCTANMHQGWPKFVSRLWMSTTDNGLAVLSYAPCKVQAKVGTGELISLYVNTNYPFNEQILINVETTSPVTFPLKLRIPKWCSAPEIKVNEELVEINEIKNGYITIDREWTNGDAIRLDLPMEIELERRADNAVGIIRGPIVFALKVKENWRKRSGNSVFPNLEVVPGSPWNYALKINKDNLRNSFIIEKVPLAQQPFDTNNAPIKLIGTAKRIPEWKLELNSAGTLPISPVNSEEMEDEVVLIPYGSARLRIAEFPVLKGEKSLGKR